MCTFNIITIHSFKSLLEPLAVAKEGNRPGPNAPAPGQQVHVLLY